MKVQFSIAAIMTALLVAFFGAVLVVGASNIKTQGTDDDEIPATCQATPTPVPATPTPVTTPGGVTPRPTRTPKATLHDLGVVVQGPIIVCATPSPTSSPSVTPQPTTSPAPGNGITPRPTRTPKPSGPG